MRKRRKLKEKVLGSGATIISIARLAQLIINTCLRNCSVSGGIWYLSLHMPRLALRPNHPPFLLISVAPSWE